MPKFLRKASIVEARQIQSKTNVETPNGEIIALPGDWLLIDFEGNEYTCVDAVFRKVYKPIDDEAAELLKVRGVDIPSQDV